MAFKRGNICMANFNPFTGSEQGGIRPALIIQNDVGNFYSPTTIVAAITSNVDKAELPTHVVIENCLPKKSMVLLEQIRTIDTSRINECIGQVTDDEIKKIDKALCISLGLDKGEKDL